MAETKRQATKQSGSWTQKQVYAFSVICMVLGFAFGYFLRGTEGTGAKAPDASVATQRVPAGMPPQMGQGAPQQPSLEDMKRMADKQSEPLLAQLKTDPKNAQLLINIANTYRSAHQFKDAAHYYQQVLDLNPKDTPLRDELGEDLYYAGEVDQAITVFEAGLKITPNDPSLLVDLGMVKLRNKGDSKGAVELWQRLLNSNPKLPADKKEQLKKLIAQAKAGKPIAVD